MAGETMITVAGNLTADPELRATNSNIPVVNFSVASTARIFDKNTNQWSDAPPNFFPTKAFGAIAEHAAASLTKGMRVTVYGSIETETWQDQATGQQRSRQVIKAEDIAVSLKYGSITGFQRAASNAQGAPQMAQGMAPQVAQPQHLAPQVHQAAPQVAQPQYANQAAPQAAPHVAPQPVQQVAPQMQQVAPQMQPQVAPQPVQQVAPQVQTSNGMADISF